MKRITIFKNGTPAEGRVSNDKSYIVFHWSMFLFSFYCNSVMYTINRIISSGHIKFHNILWFVAVYLIYVYPISPALCAL